MDCPNDPCELAKRANQERRQNESGNRLLRQKGIVARLPTLLVRMIRINESKRLLLAAACLMFLLQALPLFETRRVEDESWYAIPAYNFIQVALTSVRGIRKAGGNRR